MELDWTTKFIKFILYGINLLFVISGIILIAVGATIKSYYNRYDLFLSSSYFDLPNLLIAIGVMIFLISLIGVYGAYRESWQWTLIFSVLLGLIFVMEMSGGIAGYALRDKTESYLQTKLAESMRSYQFNQKANSITELWDYVQNEFECCGARSAKDWSQWVPKPPTSTTLSSTLSTTISSITTSKSTTTTLKPTTTTLKPTTTTLKPTTTDPTSIQKLARDEALDLPSSCCKAIPGATGTITCNLVDESTAKYYRTGCASALGIYIKGHASSLGGVGIGIGVLQLSGVVFSYLLSKKLRNYVYAS